MARSWAVRITPRARRNENYPTLAIEKRQLLTVTLPAEYLDNSLACSGTLFLRLDRTSGWLTRHHANQGRETHVPTTLGKGVFILDQLFNFPVGESFA
jgi:hypothetical protein